MSELSDKEQMQVRAETASVPKRSQTPINEVIARAHRQEGIGMLPDEVLLLADAAKAFLATLP
ncbi:MAG: hypothetical protein ACRDQZ_13170 [Mycobacteriales bacterium]